MAISSLSITKSFFFLVLLTMGSWQKGFSQDSLSATSSASFLFFYGPCQGSYFTGYIFGESLCYVDNGRIYSIRLLFAQPHEVTGFTTPFHARYKYVRGIVETSFLYGLTARNRYAFFSASIGIGYVDFRTDTAQDITTVAVPFDLRMLLNPTKILGVGIYLFGNLNPRTAYEGVTFCFQIGFL